MQGEEIEEDSELQNDSKQKDDSKLYEDSKLNIKKYFLVVWILPWSISYSLYINTSSFLLLSTPSLSNYDYRKRCKS